MMLPSIPFSNLITRKTQLIFCIVKTSFNPVSTALEISIFLFCVCINFTIAKTKLHLWIFLLGAGNNEGSCSGTFLFTIPVPNCERVYKNIFPPFSGFSDFNSISLVFSDLFIIIIYAQSRLVCFYFRWVFPPDSFF